MCYLSTWCCLCDIFLHFFFPFDFFLLDCCLIHLEHQGCVCSVGLHESFFFFFFLNSTDINLFRERVFFFFVKSKKDFLFYFFDFKAPPPPFFFGGVGREEPEKCLVRATSVTLALEPPKSKSNKSGVKKMVEQTYQVNIKIQNPCPLPSS